MSYRIALFAVVCLSLAGVAPAGEVAPVCPAPETAPVQAAEPATEGALSELLAEPQEMSCTCIQARRDCDNLCWLSGCVVGSFHCDRNDPCNYTCECAC